jgi:hypothetical protein
VRLRRSALARGLCRLVEPRTRFHNPSLRESEKRQIRPIEMQPHLRLWITLRRCGWYGCCPIKAWCPTASFMSWSVQAVSAQNSGSCSLTNGAVPQRTNAAASFRLIKGVRFRQEHGAHSGSKRLDAYDSAISRCGSKCLVTHGSDVSGQPGR